MKIKESKKKNPRRRYSARLTSKYQTTIPKMIREHLHLGNGDEIVYELLPDNSVIMRKSSPLDLKSLRALHLTLSEWESHEDEQAYNKL